MLGTRESSHKSKLFLFVVAVAFSRNVNSKLSRWKPKVRKRSKYDSHTYLDPDGKEYKGKGEVRASRLKDGKGANLFGCNGLER